MRIRIRSGLCTEKLKCVQCNFPRAEVFLTAVKSLLYYSCRDIISAQGQDWIYARSTVAAGEDEGGFGFIMIIAMVGDGNNGNIAVDDIMVKFGACGESDDDDGGGGGGLKS